MAKANTQSKETKKVVAAKKTTGKTEIVLSMVEKGKNRKEILDALCKLNPDISRKSNAGLVSHIFVAHKLIGKVESGVERAQKKEVKVKASTAAKKTTKKSSKSA